MTGYFPEGESAVTHKRNGSADAAVRCLNDFEGKRVVNMQLEKQRAFIIQAVYWAIYGVLAFVALKYSIGLILPFLMGFLFAAILQRPIRWVKKLLNTKSKLVSVAVVALFYLSCGALLGFIGNRIVAGLQKLIPLIPQLYTLYVEPFLTDAFEGFENLFIKTNSPLLTVISSWDDQFMDSLGNMVSGLSVRAMGFVSNVAASLPGIFIRTLLAVISTFFIAGDYRRITNFCLGQLNPKGREIFLQIKRYVVGTLFVCIRSYVLIMCITFAELSVFLTLIGMKHAVLIAAYIAVFDVLPVLGTGGIMIPWSVIAAVSGRLTLGLELIVIYLVVTVVRNIVEPKIVSGQLGLHPVVTMVSLFVGAQLFGAVGLFGGPILLSLLCHLNANGTISLFREEPEEKREEPCTAEPAEQDGPAPAEKTAE